MRAVVVAVLATVMASAPVAAQKGTNHHALLLQHQKEALAVAKRLEKASSLKPARLKSDVASLGKHLDAADAEIAELDKTATGGDKEAVENVKTHEKEARAHYDELVKAEPDAAGVATHAKLVSEHLDKAIEAHTSHGEAHAVKGKAKGKAY